MKVLVSKDISIAIHLPLSKLLFLFLFPQVFSLLLACASAQWFPYSGHYGGYYGYPAFHGSRYQAQDVFGQTSYGYAYPGQAANDFQDAFGNRVGSYAYRNPAGKEVRVSYTADAARGFRVLSNDLPVAVQDTPEVAAAKIEHAKALKAAPSRAKRQIAVYPTQQFVNDLHYRSVDLNQDGQPDVPVYPTYRYSWPHAYGAYPYTFGATPYSLAYPWAAPVAAAAEVKTTRTKRQAVFLPHQQFVNDLHYRSVDLNKDGQPDVPVYPAYHSVLPYAAHVAAPFVAPALAKTTLKTVTAEADLSAPTPAATNLLELKEKSIDVVTPYAYHGYHGAFPYYPYTL